MKKLLLAVILAFLSISTITLSQEIGDTGKSSTHPGSKFSFGFELDDFFNDFGLGLAITSPHYINGALAFRIRVNHSWYHGLEEDSTESTWIGYQSIRIGSVGASYTADGYIRLYGEGGLVVLLAADNLSDDPKVGGYGLFGFEIFFQQKDMSYFFELGSLGTGASADQQPTKPIYANGFLTTVGLRLYL